MGRRSTTRGEKKFCSVCRCLHHPDTVTRHERGEVPVLSRASRQAEDDPIAARTLWSLQANARPVKRLRRDVGSTPIGTTEVEVSVGQIPLQSEEGSRFPERQTSEAERAMLTASTSGAMGRSAQTEDTLSGGTMDLSGLEEADASQAVDDLEQAIVGAQHGVWAGRTRYQQATVEDDVPSDDEDGAAGTGTAGEQDTEAGAAFDEEPDQEDSEDEYEAISVWDELVESLQRAGLVSSDDLTESDLEILRPFALKVHTNMPGSTFAKLPYAFPHSNIASWKTIQSRVAQLSGFEPQLYHCCVESCCAFTGPHTDKAACPYCKASRYDAKGRPRKLFVYLPVIPRLKAYQANMKMAKKMQYRGTDHVHDPDIIKDVMDSQTYRSLLTKTVTVDEKPLKHKFFDDPRDVALGLSTDGFAPFKRRSKTAWPLILFNYNLPPETRFHLENILGLGIIPGPKKPVDFDSFLWPLVQELLRLSVGVHAYDSLSDSFFALRAYLILVFGDIPAVSMVMRMKGHNGLSPCRMCDIRGVRIPDSRATTHYVPLDRSNHPHVQQDNSLIHTYDPAHLPLRTHATFLEQARQVQLAETQADSERLAKQYGIKGIPVLSVLSSLTFPDSFPYDFMHLLWENVVKNLMQLWTGTYKDLDVGTGAYQIVAAIWEDIGAASAASGATIPYVYGPRPPNVASDKTSWTADTR